MRKINMKISGILKKNGSALLTALLVMGVLMSVSLALSSLVLREIYTTREVLDAGSAYYGAESGIEVSLYNIKHNLPGWETPKKGFVPLQVDDEKKVVTEYKVDNTCNAYPCFGSDFAKESAELSAFYDVLDLNESITVPLFVVGDDGKEHRVQNFTVEFYGVFDPMNDLKIKGDKFKISGWDILRWKILGISQNDIKNKTESISDFTALSLLNQTEGKEKKSTNAETPTWFGSVSCSDQNDRYTGEIKCTSYPKIGGQAEKTTIGDQIAKTVVGDCSYTEAREHYVYVNGEVQSTETCYPIANFLSGHKLNYLTLTNMMNPAVFDDNKFNEEERIARSKLYFRIELFGEDGKELSGGAVGGNKTVREYAEIVSNGYSGSSKQSISVNLKRDSFMPVFNFSLYSTFKTDASIKDKSWE